MALPNPIIIETNRQWCLPTYPLDDIVSPGKNYVCSQDSVIICYDRKLYANMTNVSGNRMKTLEQYIDAMRGKNPEPKEKVIREIVACLIGRDPRSIKPSDHLRNELGIDNDLFVALKLEVGKYFFQLPSFGDGTPDHAMNFQWFVDGFADWHAATIKRSAIDGTGTIQLEFGK